MLITFGDLPGELIRFFTLLPKKLDAAHRAGVK
jgi:hypothetical protein